MRLWAALCILGGPVASNESHTALCMSILGPANATCHTNRQCASLQKLILRLRLQIDAHRGVICRRLGLPALTIVASSNQDAKPKALGLTNTRLLGCACGEGEPLELLEQSRSAARSCCEVCLPSDVASMHIICLRASLLCLVEKGRPSVQRVLRSRSPVHSHVLCTELILMACWEQQRPKWTLWFEAPLRAT